LGFFPMLGQDHYRIVGIVPPSLLDRQDLTFEDIRSDIERESSMHVTETFWLSTYHVHHRVAQTFRRGRVFLLGDAGHIHSPAGETTVTWLPQVRRALVGLSSQARISYHASPISRGTAGGVQAGDRLPWVKWREGGTNYESLRLLKPQIQIYGAVPPEVEAFT